MSAIFAILWFLAILLSVFLIGQTGRMAGMVSMFPEGWKWWVPVSHYGSLGFFAIVVLNHPF